MKHPPNGTRIKQAREIRAMSVADLAAWIGLGEHDLVRIETGLSPCLQSTVECIALRTGFPLAFFHQDDPPQFSEGSMAWH